jgi:transposase
MDHPGLVAGIYKGLKLQEKVDKRLHSSDPCRGISPGQSVIAMILNGLGFSNRRLYLTPQFFENKPINKLLECDLSRNAIDDYTLDETAEYGVSQFFAEIAFSIASEEGLLGRTAHSGSTSFSVEGNYAEEGGLIKVTLGYSKEDRGDLKQVVMN